ncbi:FecR family protein [Pedobacter punctiformis]|uniref:FecR family protein n=1 Tax=Pedobacter punctiformis TaxID=3004097 RepID=A0ABT4L4G6_9SPHI|nr:FecR family protein [Pedobacter sp. HCMS5-2]MCZ4242597.1 FecR family protein [Pedobacter sp. HCMS5-2]
MEHSQYTAVDFLADETFQNYFYGTVAEDVIFWENYIKQYPEKVSEINIARQMLTTLSANKKPVSAELANFKQQFYKRASTVADVPEMYVDKGGRLKVLKYAFLALIILAGSIFFLSKTQIFNQKEIAGTQTAGIFKTERAQRKKVVLEDGTSILLNADSKITLRKGFNIKTRELDLSGEAYFEVAHNAAVPFIVHTGKMNIKVLGTVFNVKAYPNERKTEAALISGKIEASFNNQNSQKFVLKPSEKITVLDNILLKTNQNQSSVKPDEVFVGNLSLNSKNAVVETVWINNGFEINNESFAELQQKLEREYGVELVFKDKEVMNYKFTATLKDEPVTEVLKAMKTVNYFNYKIKKNIIEISK